jgi:flagellar assembly protein FliH
VAKKWSSVLQTAGGEPLQALVMPNVGPPPKVPQGETPRPQETAAERLEAERLGLAAERARLEEGDTVLRACAERLVAVREEVLRGMEEDLMTCAVAIARRVIHDEVTQRPEVITYQVQAALARVREEGTVVVRVHPTTLNALMEARPHLLNSLEDAARLRFEPDASLAPGGCIVETAQRIVDASIETQLNRIGAALRKELREAS